MLSRYKTEQDKLSPVPPDLCSNHGAISQKFSRGISTAGTEFKIAAFADDILLFLTEQHITLPNLFKETEHFQLLSNIKINYSKSHSLNNSLPLVELERCSKSFSSTWKQGAITYVRIQLSCSLSELYNQNYHPLLLKIQQALRNGINPVTLGSGGRQY